MKPGLGASDAQCSCEGEMTSDKLMREVDAAGADGPGSRCRWMWQVDPGCRN